MKWFKHFSASHNNNKLTKVRMKYGADGYAIYWYCLELITSVLGTTPEVTFELSHDAEVIGYNLKVDTLRVEEIMRYMVSLGLFESEESSGRITCLKIAKYLDKRTTRNKTIHKIIDSAQNKLEQNNSPSLVRDCPRQSETVNKLSPLDTDTDTEKRSTAVDNFFHENNLYWHKKIPFSPAQRKKAVDSFLTNELSNETGQKILDEATGQFLTKKSVERPFGLVITLGMLATDNRFKFTEHGKSIQKQRFQILQAQQKQRA